MKRLVRMSLASQILASIVDSLPAPPDARVRGPVDPRLDPDALAAFARHELSHPELPLRYAFERARDARDEQLERGHGWTPARPAAPAGAAFAADTIGTPTQWTSTIVEVPVGGTDGHRPEVEWQVRRLGASIIRSGNALARPTSRETHRDDGPPRGR
jgi:hypothetical protein